MTSFYQALTAVTLAIGLGALALPGTALADQCEEYYAQFSGTGLYSDAEIWAGTLGCGVGSGMCTGNLQEGEVTPKCEAECRPIAGENAAVCVEACRKQVIEYYRCVTFG